MFGFGIVNPADLFILFRTFRSQGQRFTGSPVLGLIQIRFGVQKS